jgi:hypothetical protein
LFILYAIPIGILAGYLLGGRLDRLGRLRFRWAPLALVGLAVQVALFSEPLGTIVGDAGPVVYVGSTVAVLVAVLRNFETPGLGLILLGAGSNLVAILANGGYMPADPAAAAAVGGIGPGYSNSSVVAEPVFEPLTDIFATPAWLPFANVFSIGDVLIGVGVAVTIVIAMRTAPAGSTADVAREPAP